MKKRIIALTVSIVLALIAAGIFTIVDGYTKSAKTKVELQNTIQQLKAKQEELEKNKLDSVENQKKIEELTKQLQAKKDSARVLAESAPKPVQSAVLLPPGSHTDWMAQAGIAASDYGYVEYIVMHEGHWNPCVINGGWVACDYDGPKAYGICQAFPGSKMASAGADWRTNPITQLKWCNSYAKAKGGWAASYNIWISKGWW